MYKIVFAAAVAALAGTASAQVKIWSMNNLSTGPDTLVTFMSNNPGVLTTVGSSGVPDGSGFGGLDFDGGGNLYGYVSFGNGNAHVGLYSINTGSGVATPVNPGNIGPNQQTLQDLAWNPATGKMYGVNGQTLYEVNLGTGATTSLGAIVGLTPGGLPVGLAFDSSGKMFVHDIASPDGIFAGTQGAMAMFHPFGIDTNFSQGMTIDWSGNNRGYHAALGSSPAFFSRLYNFSNTVPGDYVLTGNFSPDGAFPTFEGGDLAIQPIPAPGAVALIGLGGLLAARRRR